MLKLYHSKPREVILDVLRSTTSHPTAEWIYNKAKKKLPRLSLGTVYRNLRLMVVRGEALELDLGASFSRYDGTTHKHSHFTCLGCGSVMDLDFSVPAGFYDSAASGTGFEITGHQLSFTGYCEDCRRKKKK